MTHGASHTSPPLNAMESDLPSSMFQRKRFYSTIPDSHFAAQQKNEHPSE